MADLCVNKDMLTHTGRTPSLCSREENRESFGNGCMFSGTFSMHVISLTCGLPFALSERLHASIFESGGSDGVQSSDIVRLQKIVLVGQFGP